MYSTNGKQYFYECWLNFDDSLFQYSRNNNISFILIVSQLKRGLILMNTDRISRSPELNKTLCNEYDEKDFSLLIDKLERVSKQLNQNHYIKGTASILTRIIEDAKSPTMILFTGKERVGKTTLINVLLGRKLLAPSQKFPTSINTFIRFGEEEYIKAVFSDGVTVTFDIEKIHFFTASNHSIAQVLRQYLEYIEIYIPHDVLKNAILVDSTALEIGENNRAYIKPTLLRRVDEIFYVISDTSIMTEPEINFLQTLANQSLKPYIIKNQNKAISGHIHMNTQFEEEDAKAYCEDILNVSTYKALEAQKTNNMQLFIDSQISTLTHVIQSLTANPLKKQRTIIQQFMNWLQLFHKELELILEREPLQSAIFNMKEYSTNLTDVTYSQRDLEVVKSYEEEYETVSKIFLQTQTLYQLLQLISTEAYLRDKDVETFEGIAVTYQQTVRDYRNLHRQYLVELSQLEKMQSKLNNKRFMQVLLKNNDRDKLMKSRIDSLNNLRNQCEDYVETIKKMETKLLKELNFIQFHLTKLAEQKLSTILEQVNAVNVQRNEQTLHFKSYQNKVGEFMCIVEAQCYLVDEIKPYLVGEDSPLLPQEKHTVASLINQFGEIDITEDGGITQLTVSTTNEMKPISINFESNYPLHPLQLTQEDILSTIPHVPEIINNL